MTEPLTSAEHWRHLDEILRDLQAYQRANNVEEHWCPMCSRIRDTAILHSLIQEGHEAEMGEDGWQHGEIAND